MTAIQRYTVVSAIVRHRDRILMVQQADEDGLYWYIPGGVVEPGELLSEALQRELLEETGLHIARSGTLACVTQTHALYEPRQTMAFIFDVTLSETSLNGSDLTPDDPDDLIHDVEFVQVDAALQRLERVLWDVMRDPLRAYLRGEVAAGGFWEYRQKSFREFECVRDGVL